MARYGPFWLWTWSKIENFEIFQKTKNDYLIKRNDSCIMKKVKFFHFWPYLKSKWAISCQNGKMPLLIFHKLYSIGQTTRKLIESWKNIGGKLTHFCLGPKTGNGHWDPRFAIRSKIHVFCRTISWVVCILVLNRNRARKRLCHDLAILRNQLS